MLKNFDFIGKKKYAFLFSGTVIGLGIIFLIFKGGFKYGSDFQGGILIQVDLGQKSSISQLHNLLGSDVEITALETADREFLIKKNVPEDIKEEINVIRDRELKKPLLMKFKKISFKNETSYDPTQGEVIKGQAIRVSFLILALILVYIAFRFEFKFAVAAVVATIHDILAVMAFVLFLDREMDIPTVVALLTIMGYSLNDTIIVFDRIRENRNILTTEDHQLVVNKSIQQTLSRTIITSLTVLFVVFSILVLGGDAMRNLSLALFVGVIYGTYSSIFVASPLLIIWENIQNKRNLKNNKPAIKRKVEKEKKKDGIVV